MDLAITWYADNNYKVIFNKVPHIDSRFPIAGATKEQKKESVIKPYVLKEDLDVCLIDLDIMRPYFFTIPKGYEWDGASIPKWLKYTAGVNTDPRFTIPSLIHDYLCEHHEVVDNDRYFADKIFERLLFVSGVPAIKRWLMFHSVDNFQKFQGWSK